MKAITKIRRAAPPYYDGYENVTLELEGKSVFSVMTGEPEDATFARDLSSCLLIGTIAKKFYDLGKQGEEVTFEEIDVKEDRIN